MWVDLWGKSKAAAKVVKSVASRGSTTVALMAVNSAVKWVKLRVG